MNKIWFFGCSLTYGSGLRAIDASLDNRWTKLVADHFGMTEENRGSPGASNEMILQNIRDEAHRFAIQENRRLRLKDLDIESIFEIKGVAKSSIDMLLEKYKTLNKLSSASYKELSSLIDEKQATKVYQYFNK